MRIKKMIVGLSRFIQYGDLPTSLYLRKGMTVGNNFNRQSETKFDISNCWLIKIGNDVTISNKVSFICHDDSIRGSTGYRKLGTITVGNNVFIGYGSTILPNVRIGDNVIIGSHTLVTHSIPDNSVVVGIPGKIIDNYDNHLTKNVNNLKQKNKFDISWSTYAKKKMTRVQKQKMFEKLKEDYGFLYLGKYEG